MHALPPSCPPLEDYPPLFWNRVNEQVAYWQNFFATTPAEEAPLEEIRAECLKCIHTRIKRINAGRKAGQSLFELSDYVACLIVIESRN